MAGSKTGDGSASLARAADTPRARGWLLRGIGWSTTALGLIVPFAFAAGFLWFIWRVPADTGAPVLRADGIVVLTGGASRVEDALELLATGHGKRLLISGVNVSTNMAEISHLKPELAQWVHCCVDVDRSLNTLGNAVETRRWTERMRFRTLIVVTSHYHMPRAMVEIAHQLPDVTLIPYPVVTDRFKAEPWWASGATTKVLFSEYMKYIVAQMRIRLHPDQDAHQPA